MVLRVVLDTNMLMNVAQKKIDVFGEIERLLLGRVDFVILRQVVEELRKLSSTHSKAAREASLALDIIRDLKVTEEASRKGESTDGSILRVTEQIGAILATGDTHLIERARNANIPLIYLKDRSRLALEGIEPAYR